MVRLAVREREEMEMAGRKKRARVKMAKGFPPKFRGYDDDVPAAPDKPHRPAKFRGYDG
jgi:hypothetical protein